MEPWYKVVTPRKEVREGRSFNPDEFAIALERVVDGTAPIDYREPRQFLDRTCFTRALVEHIGLVLRRLDGQTESTAPVMALITQFGGGKTHTLATLLHIVRSRREVERQPRIQELLQRNRLGAVPSAKVAVFVGNAWDPSEGNETPWIDLARQLAGESGVKALGPEARSKTPGTTNLQRLFETAGGRVLVLFDEVLNFLSRHRDHAEAFRDFLANLVRAMTGTTRCAAVLSLPQSRLEMTAWDQQWQAVISREVGRVSKQLIVNEEGEISEVLRRRLFQDLGGERLRRNVARHYADWCFERRAQLPPEWTAVDSAATEKRARERLQERFEACYPFHPATLSVFQRKWQALPQYQQTRGTLAMLAQWVSRAYREGFTSARTEPLLTIGSAPLEASEFRSVILGQLGEPRLITAIDVDIAGDHAHARALDVDTRGPLRDIHRRVATAILFESSGGQVDKMAHLPELRFALGEPNMDTTSVDNAATALESRAFFIQRVGSDGFKVFHKAKVEKAVSDRRASLDEQTDIRPTMHALVKGEFERGATVPINLFPADDVAVGDLPRLTLVVLDPGLEWTGKGPLRSQLAEWTRKRGESNRLYPGSIVWCVRRPGRDFRDKVELWLAWRRVQQEVNQGLLGAEYDRADKDEIRAKTTEAEGVAKEEVWAEYRFIVLADSAEPDGLRVIDLGAGHSSGSQTLCGRVIAALKAEGLLSESVGAGYIERSWPPALKDSGAWPLASLRQSFLNGSLIRLIDPDATLRSKVVDFVARGEFGLGSGPKPGGAYERVWFHEIMPPDEIEFGPGVFLLRKDVAPALKAGAPPTPEEGPVIPPPPPREDEDTEGPPPGPSEQTVTMRLTGTIPPELWNRLGTKLIPKLRAGAELRVGVDFSVTVDQRASANLERELGQILADLGLEGRVRVSREL